MQVVLILFLVAICVVLVALARTPTPVRSAADARTQDPIPIRPSDVDPGAIEQRRVRSPRTWVWKRRDFWNDNGTLIVVAWFCVFIAFGIQLDRDLPTSITGLPIFDLSVGFLLAFAYLLRRLPLKLRVLSVSRLAFRFVATWLCATLPLLIVFELSTKPRWLQQQRIVAYYHVETVYRSVGDYAKDCGGFPTQEEGLVALTQNPGIKKWRGPYVDTTSLVDPWGGPIKFRIHDNRVEVWSAGKDGVDGTQDDIRIPEL